MEMLPRDEIMIEIRQRYLNDPVFHRLTDWMVEHMMAGTINRSDFINARYMALRIIKEHEANYGCLLNLLKEEM